MGSLTLRLPGKLEAENTKTKRLAADDFVEYNLGRRSRLLTKAALINTNARTPKSSDMKRVHVTGCSPRSGTSLMVELLAIGFEIDGYVKHEMSIAHKPEKEYKVFCSKHPNDILFANSLLRLNKNLWIVYMLRDPRDVVVSKHNIAPDQYWISLETWRRQHAAAKKLEGHERFITIRYEDLVSDPDAIQKRLLLSFPFLEKRHNFSDYHKVAHPWKGSERALGGVRPISAKSVGAWRNHKSRLLGQIKIHGAISDDLIELGYESDESWLEELRGVEPDTDKSYNHGKWTLKGRLLNQLFKVKHPLFYILGLRKQVKNKVREI